VLCLLSQPLYRTVIVSDAKNKTKFWDLQISGAELNGCEYFMPLTMKELNKLKPHLLKTVEIDYNISVNEDCSRKLPKYCCYKCGWETFGTTPIIKMHNSIGKCYGCGSDKQELYNQMYFKIPLFQDKK